VTRREIPVVAARLRAELERLDRTVRGAADVQARARAGERGEAMLALACTTLHSCYNGIERCFDLVAREVDEARPEGPTSHRDLLDQMAVAVAGLRPAVLGDALRRALLPYLDFRHRFRHLYFFDLSWSDVDPLLDGLAPLWATLRARFDNFLVDLEAHARRDG
jgi:hypothetical protein